MTVGRERVAGKTRLPVTAVICVRNREQSIAECIASVAASGPGRILVVDGRSTDATADIARESGANVVSDDGAGLGAARRLGAELAETPWIAYVDSDARVTPSTLSALLDVAEADGFDAVQAELHSSTSDLTYWQRGEIWRRRMQELPGPAALIGCQATLVRRSLLLRVPFDATFGGAAEDHDWCFRAAAAGAALAHTDRAIAYHEDRATFAEFVAQRFWYGRGMARLLMRHRRLAPQARTASAGTMRTPRYMPFMLTSWAVTALGMAVETAGLAFNPGIRRRLREGAPSGRPAIPG
jgi:glycosyltransferase involved in cell wall biosynthesis